MNDIGSSLVVSLGAGCIWLVIKFHEDSAGFGVLGRVVEGAPKVTAVEPRANELLVPDVIREILARDFPAEILLQVKGERCSSREPFATPVTLDVLILRMMLPDMFLAATLGAKVHATPLAAHVNGVFGLGLVAHKVVPALEVEIAPLAVLMVVFSRFMSAESVVGFLCCATLIGGCSFEHLVATFDVALDLDSDLGRCHNGSAGWEKAGC